MYHINKNQIVMEVLLSTRFMSDQYQSCSYIVEVKKKTGQQIELVLVLLYQHDDEIIDNPFLYFLTSADGSRIKDKSFNIENN